jgi:hypothetical protein
MPAWRGNLLSIHGFPDAPIDRQTVSLKGFSDRVRGDVDILVCERACPELSIAIEVKWVKVCNENINKLEEYRKGIRQANLLSELGFSQVWLYVLVVVDTRERNAGRYCYDGLDSKQKSKINQALTITGLNDRVGVIHHNFVQPMDYAPLTVGFSGGHIVRMATPVVQSSALTGWVNSAMGDWSQPVA